MAAISFTRGSSAMGYSPTSWPLRSTVIRSQTAYTCSKKWVTKMMPTPRSRSWRIRLKSFSTSESSREEVGSSRISTLHSISTARAMAIICCSAREYSSKFRVTSTGRFISFISFCARFTISLRLTVCSLVIGSRPMKRFSATLRLGQRLTSWYTVEMPCFCASRVLRFLTASLMPSI